MAHWFHRNPIKATEHVDFQLKSVLTTSQTSKICNELRLRRAHLLEHFKDASNDLDVLDDDFKQYLSLFSGFVFAVDHDNTKPSKLTALIRFRWCNSMLGSVATEVNDSWFELLNICVNMALWLSKHAAWIAAKDEVFEGDAKKAHTCLRRAAGILIFVRESADRVTGLTSFPGSDFDSAVLTAYINQFTAEAQEITVARAIELKHSPGLITALAYETSHLFTQAVALLSSTQVPNIYSICLCFLGENLLSQDKCGEAVRACREGVSCFDVAADFVGKYRKTNGPAVRENGFIYHQKVPDICPEPERKPTFGLVEAEPFVMPNMNPVKKSSKTLPSVQEVKVYETEHDPGSQSGCTIIIGLNENMWGREM
ncbi:hypothetical protein DINM_005832 [Dirofilaria immitis]|nr:hypothetical protein [Dirofilaria immitis]